MSSARPEDIPSEATAEPATQYERVVEARFYELDILRGLAAFLVVAFHYKHFLTEDAINFDYDHLPFHTVLMPIYVYGLMFVEMFFSISGYVFFWLYSEAVSEKRLGAQRFFIARFARLYPLFFVTFIAVAVMQLIFFGLYGQTYIYQHNTPLQFVLNLFMVHQWLPHPEQTFNGPSWSLSVEVFLYILFFTLASKRLNHPLILAGLAALAVGFNMTHSIENVSGIARGVASFFLGGLAFHAVTALRMPGREVWQKRVSLGLLWLLPCLWLLSYVRGQSALWDKMQAASPDNPLWTVFGSAGFVYAVVPLTLLLFGLKQGQWEAKVLTPERLHRFAWIGDISYSLYLIHFPLQIGIMILMAHYPFATRVAIFSSPLMLVAFLGVAAGLARLSFTYFEMPMREWIKTWLTRRLSGTAVKAEPEEAA
ncbi:acyltransferase family protein [Asticcacaulis solisilvae]|uniref:acyltransferase family protein n=1 Tax=Asticcacaulis solisilvae TaxID=1217274 RepID=UPI003FD7CF3A